MSLFEQPTEIILQILSYIYLIDWCNIKPNIHLLNKFDWNCNNLKYENKLLKKQLNDIINISKTCKYFNNIITNYGLKVLYCDSNIDIKIVQKYKCIYIIAPTDELLKDDQLRPLTNLTYIRLDRNKNITDKGLEPLTNLTYLYLRDNIKITDKGLEPLTNLTYLHLYMNRNITDKGLEPLTNLTYLNLYMNRNITDKGLEPLTKLEKCYVNYRRLK